MQQVKKQLHTTINGILVRGKSKVNENLADEISFEKFQQFIFELQWERLHTYAKENGGGRAKVYIHIYEEK